MATLPVKEAPNIVYGRLLESAHISGYSFERTCAELEWLLDDGRWQQVGPGYEHINDFLGTIDLSPFNMETAQRRVLAKRLTELRATQRPIAKALGVSQATVTNDLAEQKCSPNALDSTSAPYENESIKEEGEQKYSPPVTPIVSITPSAWFQRPQQDVVKQVEKDTEREARRALVQGQVKEVVFPTGKYRVIYADPPWQYQNTMPDYFQEQVDHYPLLTVDEIAALPVADLLLDNAVLFLWATSPILREAFDVITAWGFEYKSSFIWDKVRHVMGHYNSVRHEILLICVRGSCQPDVRKLFDSVVTEERREHGQKPHVFYEIIETLYTQGSKLELFLRGQPRPGWAGFGYEAETIRESSE